MQVCTGVASPESASNLARRINRRAALPKRMVYADFAPAPALISDCEVSDRRLAAALVSGW
jgi:hypothetical protein